jgi:CDP-4-dehydro-6-deoxyglucose reductase, E1
MVLPLSSHTWGEEEISAAKEVIESGFTTMGKHTLEFEMKFAEFTGSEFAVMSNSGSSANLLAVAAIAYSKFDGDVQGKEVIVPAVSWSTTYYPLAQLGFKLRFVDIDLNTLNLDLAQTKGAITDNTAGIFAVNLLGQAAELEEFRKLADSSNLFFLEDNCESMGATLNRKQAGTFGDIGTFSFFFSHHINTMEGGMSVTDDEKLYQFMYSLRAHGWTRGLPDNNFIFNKTGNYWDDHFRFLLPGYNLRPLEVSAAIGKIQISKFPDFLRERQVNHLYFKQVMGRNENLIIQDGKGESSAFAFSIILTNKLQGRRREVIEKLETAGIETRPVVTGNFTKQPVIKYLNAEFGELPNAQFLDENGFYIGNHHYEIKSEIDELAEILEEMSK